jgi:hypothetical protein
LLAGEGFLGLGVLERGLEGNALQVETYNDDPSRGGVVASTAIVAEADLAACPSHSAFQPDTTLILFDAAWLPFAFGLQAYDPFVSIKASLSKAQKQEPQAGTSNVQAGTSNVQADIALAFWSAMEGDLFRFAFDDGFIAGLEKARGTSEWRRFARLNDLYRAFIKAIVPSGISPAKWTTWLRNNGESIKPSTRLDELQARLLTRHIDSIMPALVKNTPADALFMLPSSAIVHIAD